MHMTVERLKASRTVKKQMRLIRDLLRETGRASA
jgi:hypothetical protein